MKREQQKRRWYGFTRVEDELQIRHVTRVLVCASVYVVISTLLFVVFYVDQMSPVAQRPTSTWSILWDVLSSWGDHEALHRVTLGWILSMAGMSALFALFVGLYVTRRVAGPLYRIKSDLTRFVMGDSSARIRLRGKDELLDLATLINRVLDASCASAAATAEAHGGDLRAELRKIVDEIRSPDFGSSDGEAMEALAERLETLADPARPHDA